MKIAVNKGGDKIVVGGFFLRVVGCGPARMLLVNHRVQGRWQLVVLHETDGGVSVSLDDPGPYWDCSEIRSLPQVEAFDCIGVKRYRTRLAPGYLVNGQSEFDTECAEDAISLLTQAR